MHIQNIQTHAKTHAHTKNYNQTHTKYTKTYQNTGTYKTIQTHPNTCLYYNIQTRAKTLPDLATIVRLTRSMEQRCDNL